MISKEEPGPSYCIEMNVLIVGVFFASAILLRKEARKKKDAAIKLPPLSVPFIYIVPSSAAHNSESINPFLSLYRILEKFKEDSETVVSSIILSHEIAMKSEWSIFPDDDNRVRFSSRLEARIQRTAEVLELDYFELKKFLRPFDLTYALSSPSNVGWTAFESDELSSSYDSAMQIITHIVRDWSKEGKMSRDSLYHWCIETLIKYRSREGCRDAPVLVPGAGLGRLARDVSLVGFDVEANELSLCMSAVAHGFLNNNMTAGHVHPFAIDFLTNEVTSTDRYQKVKYTNEKDDFLDRIISGETGLRRGSLSYTIGDFVEIYSQQSRRGTFGAVITCFFIDTASNIYEYLLAIRNILKGGGVWINVGPLQWHQNAKLHPSSDELRVIIESVGFKIESWSIDKTAINYRYDDTREETRHTKYEGYRPLRFVATLPKNIRHSLMSENAALKILGMRSTVHQTSAQTRNDFQFKDFPAPANTVSNVTITEL